MGPSEATPTPACVRPAPVVTALAEPYWTAAREGRLVLQHCDLCDGFTHFPSDACAHCGQSRGLGWREVSGRGRVYTFSVIHRTGVPGFELPYVVAWIDLAAGARVFGNVRGCPPERVRIDMPVQVTFEQIEAFGPVPTFTAADE